MKFRLRQLDVDRDERVIATEVEPGDDEHPLQRLGGNAALRFGRAIASTAWAIRALGAGIEQSYCGVHTHTHTHGWRKQACSIDARESSGRAARHPLRAANLAE